MRIYKTFNCVGKSGEDTTAGKGVQTWTVPEGILNGEALFECWGASGGVASPFEIGRKSKTVGGKGRTNNSFTNNPSTEGQLGTSYSNGAGYAAGIKPVTAGDVYYIFVGGNGQPGSGSIREKANGDVASAYGYGGKGGFNGGGDGGKGAHTYQNLYNSTSTKVQYKRSTRPAKAKAGQLWLDTTNDIVKKCNQTYTSGGTDAMWDKVTSSHGDDIGPSAGGGGGATDIRSGGYALSDRILVAGGSGGAAGPWARTGTTAWRLAACPVNPAPPFGSDNVASGATGPNHTWTSQINYLVGGWGLGGLGGGTGPTPNASPTTDGGAATNGGSGGPAAARHKDGKTPAAAHGSNGGGGTNVAGGSKGVGGSNGTAGSLGSGGRGADAAGGDDDFCAGGGGGGGGYYGGGGGGHGFRGDGNSTTTYTKGGGGGGGSNYASSDFSSYLLCGGARPPQGAPGHAAANGLGGFARITYDIPPVVELGDMPNAVSAATDFTVSFVYTPADDGSTGLTPALIDHFIVGTNSDPNATSPSSQTTIMVADHSQTDFTYTFTAPAAGVQAAYFVQVVDTDGDPSDWASFKVTGLSSGDVTGATITSPAADSQFEQSATVDWTVGTQTPLVAYRLGVSGTDLVSGAVRGNQSPWRRGGSRVNLATDPGFEGSAVWSSDANTALVSDTSFPGVSGKNGKIAWALTDAFDAENHTTHWDNLIPGVTYRLHIEVASGTDYDFRPVEFQVWDYKGLLTTYTVVTSGLAHGSYQPIDIEFTPRGQGVYLNVRPSATSVTVEEFTTDFEDGTTGGFGSPAASDSTQSNSGSLAIKNTAASTLDMSTLLTNGAETYFVDIWGYAPSAAGSDLSLTISGAGILQAVTVGSTVRDQWVNFRVPFGWFGSGAADLVVSGDASGHWWDDLTISLVDDTDAETGNADSGQITYLKDMLLELRTAEDGTAYQTYFDGSNANSNPGTVSWAGTANASASVLTGTDVVTGDITYTGTQLLDGSLYLDTLNVDSVEVGYSGPRSSIAVSVNPSLPATPTVALEVNSVEGLMKFTIDAADGSATYKTTSFDIFRDGVRIATGLVPDGTTRQAVYTDAPGHAEAVTYLVRAFDAAGGYVDQTDGTVTVVD